jgi:predicted HTH domain antitoxin
MSVSFDLPTTIEEELRKQFSDLDQVAKEALGVELYRQRRISHHQLAQLLGLTRFETDGVLKRHGVYDELTLDDVRREADSLAELRNEC